MTTPAATESKKSSLPGHVRIALLMYARQGALDLLLEQLKQFPISPEDMLSIVDGKTKSTLLFRAAEAGHADIVSMLVQAFPADCIAKLQVMQGDAQPDPSLPKDGPKDAKTDTLIGFYTPLQIAAYRGHADVVKVLLAAPGAEAALNMQDPYGNLPLHSACWTGHTPRSVEIVKLLIAAAPSSVNAKDNVGETPLFKIMFWRQSSRDHCAIVKLLIDNGADVEAKKKDGQTVLEVVTKYGDGSENTEKAKLIAAAVVAKK